MVEERPQEGPVVGGAEQTGERMSGGNEPVATGALHVRLGPVRDLPANDLSAAFVKSTAASRKPLFPKILSRQRETERKPRRGAGRMLIGFLSQYYSQGCHHGHRTNLEYRNIPVFTCRRKARSVVPQVGAQKMPHRFSLLP